MVGGTSCAVKPLASTASCNVTRPSSSVADGDRLEGHRRLTAFEGGEGEEEEKEVEEEEEGVEV